MATAQQRKALDLIVERGRKGKKVSVSQIMREVGYSPSTASVPGKLTKAPGFIELCDELGLTDNFLTRALVADIKKKKGNRTRELELGFKVRGRLKETVQPIQNNLNVIISDEQLARIAGRLAGRGDSNGGISSETPSSGLRDSHESEVRAELASRENSEGA